MNIWIDGKPYQAKRHREPMNGYEAVLILQDGVPVSEHTLPTFFLNGANVEAVITGGHTYAKQPRI
jgi:hypothetical protein